MATRRDQPKNMFMLNPRDKANLLIMTTRPTGIRSVFADFDAPGLPQWSVVCKNLSENAKMAKLFYMGDADVVQDTRREPWISASCRCRMVGNMQAVGRSSSATRYEPGLADSPVQGRKRVRRRVSRRAGQV